MKSIDLFKDIDYIDKAKEFTVKDYLKKEEWKKWKKNKRIYYRWVNIARVTVIFLFPFLFFAGLLELISKGIVFILDDIIIEILERKKMKYYKKCSTLKRLAFDRWIEKEKGIKRPKISEETYKQIKGSD